MLNIWSIYFWNFSFNMLGLWLTTGDWNHRQGGDSCLVFLTICIIYISNLTTRTRGRIVISIFMVELPEACRIPETCLGSHCWPIAEWAFKPNFKEPHHSVQTDTLSFVIFIYYLSKLFRTPFSFHRSYSSDCYLLPIFSHVSVRLLEVFLLWLY